MAFKRFPRNLRRSFCCDSISLENGFTKHGLGLERPKITRLNVPFPKNDLVKKYGGKWDYKAKAWTISGPIPSILHSFVIPHDILPVHNPPPVQQWITLDVPFADREKLKWVLGTDVKWDLNEKKWKVTKITPEIKQWVRTYLSVPFIAKDFVKEQGGKWDPKEKSWYFVGVIPDSLKPYVSISLQVDSSPHSETLITNDSVSSPSYSSSLTSPASSSSSFSSTSSPLTSSSPSSSLPLRSSSDYTSPSSSFSSSLSTSSSHSRSHFSFPSHSFSHSRISSPYLIIFDTETTGLPSSPTAQYDQLEFFHECRLIQLSYLICDLVTLEPLQEITDYIIQSDGFPINNSIFHGITLEKSLSEGLLISDVMNKIHEDFIHAHYIIAHNVSFDRNILLSELFRLKNKTTTTTTTTTPTPNNNNNNNNNIHSFLSNLIDPNPELTLKLTQEKREEEWKLKKKTTTKTTKRNSFTSNDNAHNDHFSLNTSLPSSSSPFLSSTSPSVPSPFSSSSSYRYLTTIPTQSSGLFVCSMNLLKPIIKATNSLGRLKSPSLKELYQFATQETIQNQHDSKYDVINLHKALKILYDSQLFQLPTPSSFITFSSTSSSSSSSSTPSF